MSTAGTASFATNVDFPTSSNPRGIAIQDLDEDGKPEIVITNYAANSISVLKNRSPVSAMFPLQERQIMQHVVAVIGDIYVPGVIYTGALRVVQLRGRSRATITRMPYRSITGKGAYCLSKRAINRTNQ